VLRFQHLAESIAEKVRIVEVIKTEIRLVKIGLQMHSQTSGEEPLRFDPGLLRSGNVSRIKGSGFYIAFQVGGEYLIRHESDAGRPAVLRFATRGAASLFE